VKKPKKYHLVKVTTDQETCVADLLKPFDIEIIEDEEKNQGKARRKSANKYPPSKLPISLQRAMKDLTDSTMLTQAMKKAGVNVDAMPLGKLTSGDIKQAQQILVEIRHLLHKIFPPSQESDETDDKKEGEASSTKPTAAKEMGEEEKEKEKEDDDEEGKEEEDGKKETRQKVMQAQKITLDEARKIYDEIGDLSNRFYELIPHSNYASESIPPINTECLLNEKFTMLSDLVEIQTASKILLGAHYRSKEINPLDYCYSAMGISLQDIPKETDEYMTLEKYIRNTAGKSLEAKHMTNIYKLQRKGEPERFQKWEKLHNHQLLFHGSFLSNFVGILSQGLRIAPPEASVSGYAFGKGVYFADMFQKSFAYCRMIDYSTPKTGFVLLCQVALGEMNEVKKAKYMEKPPKGFHSTKAIGQRGPDSSQSIVLSNGVRIPLGEVIDYPVAEEDKDFYCRLQHNEYIVYDAEQVQMRYLIQVTR